jgi:hypothetical protein
MKFFKSLLFGFFFILLITIAVEVLFLYSVKNKAPSNNLRTTKTGQPLHKTTSVSISEYKEMATSTIPAFHPSIIKDLEKYVKFPDDNNAKLLIYQENKTKVLAIEPKGACVEDRRNGVLYPGEICFPFAMKIEDKKLPHGYTWIYFTETNLKNTNVYIKKNGREIKTNLQSIKPNDIVKTVEKWDPSIPFDISKLKDYLDKQMVEFNIYIY